MGDLRRARCEIVVGVVVGGLPLMALLSTFSPVVRVGGAVLSGEVDRDGGFLGYVGKEAHPPVDIKVSILLQACEVRIFLIRHRSLVRMCQR